MCLCGCIINVVKTRVTNVIFWTICHDAQYVVKCSLYVYCKGIFD